MEQVLGEVIEFLRNLMIVAACGKETELLDVPDGIADGLYHAGGQV